MVKMSIGAAFSETFAFLKANWLQMLMWLGGALLLIGLLGYLLLGSMFSAMAMAPGDPSIMMGAFGKLMLFTLIEVVILYAACMIIWRGGMYPGEAPNFGWAFQAGPAYALGLLVLFFGIGIVLAIILTILSLIFLGGMGSLSPAAFESGAVGGGALALGAIIYIALIVLFLWVVGRFSIAGPVMADRLTRNPITGFTESWKLTAASQWTIVGFYVIFTILVLVYYFLAILIFGSIIGASASSGSIVGVFLVGILMLVVVYLPLMMISFSIPVGLFRALTPRASGDVFA